MIWRHLASDIGRFFSFNPLKEYAARLDHDVIDSGADAELLVSQITFWSAKTPLSL